MVHGCRVRHKSYEDDHITLHVQATHCTIISMQIVSFVQRFRREFASLVHVDSVMVIVCQQPENGAKIAQLNNYRNPKIASFFSPANPCNRLQPWLTREDTNNEDINLHFYLKC